MVFQNDGMVSVLYMEAISWAIYQINMIIFDDTRSDELTEVCDSTNSKYIYLPFGS